MAAAGGCALRGRRAAGKRRVGGVLTYGGALLLESYDLSPAVVALGLAAGAAAMVPGTFIARRAIRTTPATLIALTGFQGGAVLVLGTVRPSPAFTMAVFAVMAFVNGGRSLVASALGMGKAPEDRVAVMSMRAAANQFGYLLGAAAGGLALGLGGFPALGVTLSAMFGLATFAPRQSSDRPAPVARSRIDADTRSSGIAARIRAAVRRAPASAASSSPP